ncbi:MAG: hypothetical protein PSV18_06660 [Methylobacter sp.]|nr:hypothetical protein [Candidatus Methylobacter titanis]
MTNNLDKTALEIKQKSVSLKEEISGLKKENDALKQDNAKLHEINKTLIVTSRGTIDAIRNIQKLNENVPEITRIAEILAATTVHETYQEIIDDLQKNGMDQSNLSKEVMSLTDSLSSIVEKYTNGPQVVHQIAADFWAPWIVIYDDLITRNKEQSWALKKIKDDLEANGVWFKRTKGKSISPNRSTVLRNMVTDRACSKTEVE